MGGTLVLVNGAAGQVPRRWRATEAALRQADVPAPVEVVRAPDAAALTRTAAQAVAAGVERVLVAGGDGTLRAAAAALVGTTVPLGVLPLGTGNDFARGLGIPLHPAAAVAVAAGGRVRTVDVGWARPAAAPETRPGTGFLFLNALGLGFDAAVAARVQAARRLCRLGRFAYGVAALGVLRGHRPQYLRVEVDGRPLFTGAAWLVAVLNGSQYGGGIRLCPRARPDDGRLDVCVVCAVPPHRLPQLLLLAYRGGHADRSDVVLSTGRSVRIVGEAPLHADGEAEPDERWSCRGGVQLQVRPSCLRVMTPVGG